MVYRRAYKSKKSRSKRKTYSSYRSKFRRGVKRNFKRGASRKSFSKTALKLTGDTERRHYSSINIGSEYSWANNNILVSEPITWKTYGNEVPAIQIFSGSYAYYKQLTLKLTVSPYVTAGSTNVTVSGNTENAVATQFNANCGRLRVVVALIKGTIDYSSYNIDWPLPRGVASNGQHVYTYMDELMAIDLTRTTTIDRVFDIKRWLNRKTVDNSKVYFTQSGYNGDGVAEVVNSVEVEDASGIIENFTTPSKFHGLTDRVVVMFMGQNGSYESQTFTINGFVEGVGNDPFSV